MGGIAAIAKAAGFRVTGSERRTSGIYARFGIRFPLGKLVLYQLS